MSQLGTASWLRGEAAPAWRQVSRPPSWAPASEAAAGDQGMQGTSAEVPTGVEVSPRQLFCSVHTRLT